MKSLLLTIKMLVFCEIAYSHDQQSPKTMSDIVFSDFERNKTAQHSINRRIKRNLVVDSGNKRSSYSLLLIGDHNDWLLFYSRF